MRCGHCGRWGRRHRAGRAPDGRLRVGWCENCLAEAHLRALGLLAPEQAARAGRPARPIEPAAGPPIGPLGVPGRAEREAGLKGLAAILVGWGISLLVIGVGLGFGFGPPGEGNAPGGVQRRHLFLIAGAFVAVIGAGVGLSTLGRAERRRSLARSVEVAASALGLAAIGLGIAFHDSRRDPWVVAAVALAALAAWAARQSSRCRDPAARPIALG